MADTATHLLIAADARWGPTQDAPTFLPLLATALAELHALPQPRRCQAVLADAGYDSERNRAGARALGVPHPVIALNRRRSAPSQAGHHPRTPERRRAALHFPRRRYRQRAQAESVFSRFKRRFGATLRAHTPAAQLREVWLRVIAFNTAILLLRHYHPSTEPETQRQRVTEGSLGEDASWRGAVN